MSRTRSPRARSPRAPTVMSFAPPPPSRPPPHDHPIDPEFATRYIPPDECEFHPPTTCNGLSVTREDIEAVLGMRVMSFELYETACTHKTAATAMSVPSYERLEFIGDSVLNFVVAKYLFDTYPTKDEGFLTRVRTKLVSGKFLSVVAWRMGMHRVVVMDQNGLMRGWNASAGVLEDVFEALVGAMYLDLGLVEAREFILRIIGTYADDTILIDANHKDRLTKHLRQLGSAVRGATYRETRDETTRVFTSEALLNGRVLGRGTGGSKREAQMAASSNALRRMGVGDELIS